MKWRRCCRTCRRPTLESAVDSNSLQHVALLRSDLLFPLRSEVWCGLSRDWLLIVSELCVSELCKRRERKRAVASRRNNRYPEILRKRDRIGQAHDFTHYQ